MTGPAPGIGARFARNRLFRWIRWYLREISGAADYDRHCLRHRREHPDRPIPSRRAYEAWRTRRREENPQARCC
ncbi:MULTISPECIES: YbdD/YjiX family protein [unclassified Embleya]|uniref:YbdD/YjiX family protein n=1 Tax=unclassified Embleya TaxID=2699296 RepID=UPI0033D2FB6A